MNAVEKTNLTEKPVKSANKRKPKNKKNQQQQQLAGVCKNEVDDKTINGEHTMSVLSEKLDNSFHITENGCMENLPNTERSNNVEIRNGNRTKLLPRHESQSQNKKTNPNKSVPKSTIKQEAKVLEEQNEKIDFSLMESAKPNREINCLTKKHNKKSKNRTKVTAAASSTLVSSDLAKASNSNYKEINSYESSIVTTSNAVSNVTIKEGGVKRKNCPSCVEKHNTQHELIGHDNSLSESSPISSGRKDNDNISCQKLDKNTDSVNEDKASSSNCISDSDRLSSSSCTQDAILPKEIGPSNSAQSLTDNVSSLDRSNIVIEYKEYESELQMQDIMRLIQTELSEPYSIYTYRYFIYNWPKLCFLAAHGNEYVGAIVCKLDMHINVKRGYIAMLAVKKEYRKLRIGTNLVQKAIEAMLADNADEVVLETEMKNIPALRLYENLGFVRDKRLFRYYLNGVDALRLKLWFR